MTIKERKKVNIFLELSSIFTRTPYIIMGVILLSSADTFGICY